MENGSLYKGWYGSMRECVKGLLREVREACWPDKESQTMQTSLKSTLRAQGKLCYGRVFFSRPETSSNLHHPKVILQAAMWRNDSSGAGGQREGPAKGPETSHRTRQIPGRNDMGSD